MRLRQVATVLLATLVLAGHRAAAQSSPGGWQLKTQDAQSTTSVTLTLVAATQVKGWLRSARPVLTIQCRGGTAAAYVETGVALEVTQVDQQVVRVRWDTTEFHSERWREVGNWTISPHHPTDLVARLLHAKRFTLEFTPFSGLPALADFAVQGLAQYSQPLATYCGIREAAESATRDGGEKN